MSSTEWFTVNLTQPLILKQWRESTVKFYHTLVLTRVTAIGLWASTKLHFGLNHKIECLPFSTTWRSIRFEQKWSPITDWSVNLKLFLPF